MSEARLTEAQRMHRRAQRAEGELARLTVEMDDIRRRWLYWLHEHQKGERRGAAMREAEPRSQYWLAPKPRLFWLSPAETEVAGRALLEERG